MMNRKRGYIMKKMDRMMAILMALQQRSETAQSLADKFEVSKRTVLRDMQALSEIGIPLYALSGPGGGYRLMDGFRLPPLQLDSAEALTLLLALDGMSKYTKGPFHSACWTVSDKIRAILPEQTLHQVGSLLQHVEMEVPDRYCSTPHLTALMNFTAHSKWLKVMYRSEQYHRCLHILPRRVYAANGYWYCEAYSLLHEEIRTLRVDRMETIEEVDPFEYDEMNKKMKDNVGHKRSSSSGKSNMPVPGPVPDPGPGPVPGPNPDPATIYIYARLTYRGALFAEQDSHMGHLVKQIGDDEWAVSFQCPNTEWKWAISFFFTMGLDAEVIEPKQLREEIRERAQHLIDKYDPVNIIS